MIEVTKAKLKELAYKCLDNVGTVRTVSYSPSREVLTVVFEWKSAQMVSTLDKVSMFYLHRYIRETFGTESELIREWGEDNGRVLVMEFIFVNGDSIPAKPHVTVIDIPVDEEEIEDSGEIEVHLRGIYPFSSGEVRKIFEGTGVDVVIVQEDDCKTINGCGFLPTSRMFKPFVRGTKKILIVTLCTAHRYDFIGRFSEDTKKKIKDLYA